MSEQKRNFDEFEEFSLGDYEQDEDDFAYNASGLDELFPAYEETPVRGGTPQEELEEEFVPDFGDALTTTVNIKPRKTTSWKRPSRSPEGKNALSPCISRC